MKKYFFITFFILAIFIVPFVVRAFECENYVVPESPIHFDPTIVKSGNQLRVYGSANGDDLVAGLYRNCQDGCMTCVIALDDCEYMAAEITTFEYKFDNGSYTPTTTRIDWKEQYDGVDGCYHTAGPAPKKYKFDFNTIDIPVGANSICFKITEAYAHGYPSPYEINNLDEQCFSLVGIIPPSCSISASPNPVNNWGDATTLTWNSINANNDAWCNPNWDNLYNRLKSGTEEVYPATETTYTLDCTDGSYNYSCSTTITRSCDCSEYGVGWFNAPFWGSCSDCNFNSTVNKCNCGEARAYCDGCKWSNVWDPFRDEFYSGTGPGHKCPGAPCAEEPTLSCSVAANPSSGTKPLNDVDLTASVNGTAIGNIVYAFDCTNNGTYEYTSSAISTNPYTRTNLCDYATAGTYTVKARITREGISATCTTQILVTPTANGLTTFRTPTHAYPRVDFTYLPKLPNLNENINLTDISTCYDESTSGSDCSITKGDIYQWTMTGGTPSSAVTENTTTKFPSPPGLKGISLQITDSDGHTCTTTKLIRINYPLPVWREVMPF